MHFRFGSARFGCPGGEEQAGVGRQGSAARAAGREFRGLGWRGWMQSCGRSPQFSKHSPLFITIVPICCDVLSLCGPSGRSSYFKFDGGDLMKILFLQMKRYSEFARLCFRSERVFVMGGDPTKNCNFHRGKVGLLWSKNLNLVCRENCFANRDCSPNPPFPLHLMKCQPQCSAANSYFVPQQSMSTVTR